MSECCFSCLSMLFFGLLVVSHLPFRLIGLHVFFIPPCSLACSFFLSFLHLSPTFNHPLFSFRSSCYIFIYRSSCNFSPSLPPPCSPPLQQGLLSLPSSYLIPSLFPLASSFSRLLPSSFSPFPPRSSLSAVSHSCLLNANQVKVRGSHPHFSLSH